MGASRLRVKELIEYGMLAELLGRLPVQVQLEELTQEELYGSSPSRPTRWREYAKRWPWTGELELQESALSAIVEYSVEKKLGRAPCAASWRSCSPT